MENATGFIFQIGILIFSVVIHEVSHGFAALALGDRTAKDAGRLTLNPVPHIDPIGSILVPMMGFFFGGMLFGWARPVPFNPHNLRNQQWGPALVGAAGPLSNLATAVFFGIIIQVLRYMNVPLDSAVLHNFLGIVAYIILINLVLAVFNFLPIPPLDGSRVFFALLPYRYQHVQYFFEQYGLFLIIALMFFFPAIISPAVNFLFNLLTGSYFY